MLVGWIALFAAVLVGTVFLVNAPAEPKNPTNQPVCGDNKKEGTEACDGTDLNGQTCQSQGFWGGTLKCKTDCKSFDTANCNNYQCGNGIVEPGEQCDGTNLNGQSCESLGLQGGTLSRYTTCAFNTSQCTTQPTRELFFNASVYDGALHQIDGTGTTSRDTILLPAIPSLKNFGFKKFFMVGYPGITKDLATAKAYYGPIEALGVDVIPGISMNDVFYNVPGWDEYSGPPNYDHNHSKNPDGLVYPEFWNTFEQLLVILGNAVKTRTVYIDTEVVYWYHRGKPFWTDENLAVVRLRLEAMSQHLLDQNIRLITYHPALHPYVPELTHITTKLYNNSDTTNAYGFTEQAVPLPYFRPEIYNMYWNQIEQLYTGQNITNAGLANGGVPYRLSQGFIYWTDTDCERQFEGGPCKMDENGHLIYMGWTAQQFREAWINHPEFKSGWLFPAQTGILTASQEFAQLPPLPP